ncbi:MULTISPECIES: Asp23/Gls24 family envelope stress response protein [unclassified Streptomyces]|uniref:Asp23/Gls24 family envelope stress response protein n=1 Tax=unclassified Streptomyces TaxID=2593676 RepID=UPI0035D6B8F4
MTDTSQRSDRGTSTGPSAVGGRGQSAGRGRTSIADIVVLKIAAMATREVGGVHAMGNVFRRAAGAVRDATPGAGRASVTRGVKAEVGERQAAIDLAIVAEYGARIGDVADEVRENVISTLERLTGLEVVEVNIYVSDVHLPDEEEDEPEGPRRVA